jgi:uncharacterized protein (TIGR00304 family)
VRLGQVLGPVFLLAGLIALAWAVANGEASVALVFVVPVVIGSGPFAFLGVLLIFVGFFLTFLFWTSGAAPPVPGPAEVPTAAPAEPGRPRRWGGVLFLGPIPLVFGSDPEMTRMMLILGVILFIALLVLTIALVLF